MKKYRFGAALVAASAMIHAAQEYLLPALWPQGGETANIVKACLIAGGALITALASSSNPDGTKADEPWNGKGKDTEDDSVNADQ
jgi:hypothetical protein